MGLNFAATAVKPRPSMLRLKPIAALLLWTAASCTDPSTAPVRGSTRVDTAWVTAEAYSHVDAATGLFRLNLPVGRFVTLLAAESLAVADAKWLGNPALIGNLVSTLEQEHGGPIAFAVLAPCERPTYAVSAYADFPPPVPGWVRRGFGSHWAIPMCQSGGPAQLSVGIPDEPRDLRIVDGQLVFRQFGGGEDLNLYGISVRFPSGLPLTPEEAVEAVYRTTHVRTSDTPTAYNLPVNLPLCASWRVPLERGTSVRDVESGETALATELYVRHVPACLSDSVAFYMPQNVQPQAAWVRFPKDTTGLGNPLDIDSALVRLSGPMLFRRVVSER